MKVLFSFFFITCFTFKNIAQTKLRVMVIFAHPDEGEIYAGGVTALYTQMGHQVKFLSLTNGDAGHYEMKPEALAKRRYQEAMKAKKILGLADYEILDYHDKYLKNTEESRKKVINSIERFEPDVVFSYYPAKGGHNDNMTAGYIVREAASSVRTKKAPVYLYMRDFHTINFSHIPDFAVLIDSVWETKLAACSAHESQVIEANPKQEGVLEEVLASKEKQREFLIHNTIPFSRPTPDKVFAAIKWYGRQKAEASVYMETFELAEFERQVSDKEAFELLPMMGGHSVLHSRK